MSVHGSSIAVVLSHHGEPSQVASTQMDLKRSLTSYPEGSQGIVLVKREKACTASLTTHATGAAKRRLTFFGSFVTIAGSFEIGRR